MNYGVRSTYGARITEYNIQIFDVQQVAGIKKAEKPREELRANLN